MAACSGPGCACRGAAPVGFAAETEHACVCVRGVGWGMGKVAGLAGQTERGCGESLRADRSHIRAADSASRARAGDEGKWRALGGTFMRAVVTGGGARGTAGGPCARPAQPTRGPRCAPAPRVAERVASASPQGWPSRRGAPNREALEAPSRAESRGARFSRIAEARVAAPAIRRDSANPGPASTVWRVPGAGRPRSGGGRRGGREGATARVSPPLRPAAL